MAHSSFPATVDVDAAEVARMRNALVVGMQMPATPFPQLNERPGTPSVTDYDTLSAWISQGAPAPNCN
jgi:hypothetical protein